MTKIDFQRYEKFVDAVTSDASTDFVALSDRLVELDEKGANIERLLTAGVGINAEGGEFLEIIKKMIFQGKPFNEDNKEHMIIELGDLMWYVAQACMALEVPFDQVIARNVKKLEARYPGGSFDVYYSENRASGRFVINLEMSMNDAVVLRHSLFMYTKYHPEFFTDERILKIREISQRLDKEIEKEFDIKYKEEHL